MRAACRRVFRHGSLNFKLAVLIPFARKRESWKNRTKNGLVEIDPEVLNLSPEGFPLLGILAKISYKILFEAGEGCFVSASNVLVLALRK